MKKDNDETIYCKNPICEWEAVEERTRKDGTVIRLCCQCAMAWDMALVDGRVVEPPQG